MYDHGITGRLRARDIGIVPGILPPGPLNASTDVAWVRVGHVTLREGDHVRHQPFACRMRQTQVESSCSHVYGDCKERADGCTSST